jgi:signal transduction histidine kinase
VVAELAGLLRGRAWVEDAAGGGARFVVEIPVAAEARG